MELRNRTRYLKQLISFQDTDLIKVVTGIRRCGKSSLLELMEEHLRENGVAAEQIVSMNFESMQYADMDSKALYQAVMERKLAGKRLYLFFDEVQKVPQWQNAVNSFRIDLDCDIYVTGSNAFLLSADLATLFTGRYIEIHVFPFSFQEYCQYYDNVSDKDKLFDDYSIKGGLAGSYAYRTEKDRTNYIKEVYETIVTRT